MNALAGASRGFRPKVLDKKHDKLRTPDDTQTMLQVRLVWLWVWLNISSRGSC
jgi:hypothetical protein